MTTENKKRRTNSSLGIKRGPYPHNWCTGPDPRRHEQYYAWLKHKSQAAYRLEEHTLSFEQWETMWNTDYAWENRGRDNLSINLCRIDKEKGWHQDNVQLVVRRSYLQANAFEHFGMHYKRNKK
jgi:hypothetical protein